MGRSLQQNLVEAMALRALLPENLEQKRRLNVRQTLQCFGRVEAVIWTRFLQLAEQPPVTHHRNGARVNRAVASSRVNETQVLNAAAQLIYICSK